MAFLTTGTRPVGAALLGLAAVLAVQYVPAKRALVAAGLAPPAAAVLTLGAVAALLAVGLSLVRRRRRAPSSRGPSS